MQIVICKIPYNTLTAIYPRECLGMPVHDPPIPFGLLKCMQPKRVAHERSEGVLPFKVQLPNLVILAYFGKVLGSSQILMWPMEI